LPDLRGKTIAGYDENDSTMNIIGKLLGQKTHTHTSAAHTHTIGAHTHSTGNHTLTVAEMPSHRHDWSKLFNADSSGGSWVGDSQFSVAAKRNIASTQFPDVVTSNQMEYHMNSVGGSGAHNHGNTGSTSLTSNSTTPGATGSNSNFQPTITMNWIVKAVMLIPEYFVVENTLNSNSADNALSAAQGKALNEKFTDYATKSEMIQYLPLSGATLTGTLKLPTNKYFNDSVCGLDCSNSDVVNINGLYWGDLSDSQDEGIHFMRSNGKWDTLRASDGVLYFHPDRTVNQSTASCRVNVDYKPGDTYYVKCPQANMIGGLGGTLSNSNTEVRFLLLLPRSLVNIKSVTVNILKLNIRHPDGGYIGPSSAVDNGYDFLSNYPIYVHLMGENMLNICIKNENGWGYTNNTPLSIEPNEIKLTFA
jgi:microcystin-dependent protein